MILRGIGADPAPGAEGPIQQQQAITFTTGDTIVGKVKKATSKAWNENPLVMGGIAVLALGLGYWTGRK